MIFQIGHQTNINDPTIYYIIKIMPYLVSTQKDDLPIFFFSFQAAFHKNARPDS